MIDDSILDKLALDKIKTQSDYLADKIKYMIVTRELDEGFVFPNENDFCKRLKVSRGTLREAYKILDTQGFICRTKHGTYLKKREDIANQGNFAASLDLAGEREMIEFVCALEPEAVYLAAQKINDAGISRLEELLVACEADSDNWKALMNSNYEFHAYIRELAGNNLIKSALVAYYDIFNQQIIFNIYSENENTGTFMQNSLKQHRDLFNAIIKHDADKAKEIERKHLLDDIEFRELHK